MGRHCLQRQIPRPNTREFIQNLRRSKHINVKCCTRCGCDKPLENFHMRGSKRRGVCSSCTRLRMNEYYRTPFGRAHSLLSTCRDRAKRKGLAFNLDALWIAERIEVGCAITHLPFDLSDNGLSRNAYAPSLDRINHEKGYTKKNTQIVLYSYDINRIWETRV